MSKKLKTVSHQGNHIARTARIASDGLEKTRGANPAAESKDRVARERGLSIASGL